RPAVSNASSVGWLCLWVLFLDLHFECSCVKFVNTAGCRSCSLASLPSSKINEPKLMIVPVSFVTGVTGLVGGELLQRLLKSRPDRQAIILARTPAKVTRLGENKRVTVVEGDLTKPRLGLNYSARRRIRNEVTEIVHCGAQTRF